MRIGQLDSMRGVFALLVVAYHTPVTHLFMDAQIVRNGHVAVYFFFVLSGFVITLAYGRRIASRVDAARFVVARIGRLWPLHLFVMTMLVGIVAMRVIGDRMGAVPYGAGGAGDPLALRFLVQGLMLHAFSNEATGEINSVSWSIAVEFWLYLLFAATLLLGGRRIAVAATLAAIALGFAALAGLVTMPFGNARMGFWLALFYFPIGVVGYRAWDALRARGGRVGTWVELACVASFAALLWAWDDLPMPHLWGALCFGGGIVLLALGDGAVSRALNAPIMTMLGDRSYSIYMIHMLVLILFGITLRITEIATGWSLYTMGDFDGATIPLVTLGGALGANLGFAGLLLLIVYLSGLTYRYVELPGQRFARRLTGARPALEGGPAAEARTA